MLEFEHNELIQKEIMRLNIEILELKYVKIDKYWTVGNRIVPFTRIYFIDEGEAEICCNDEHIKLLPGNIYVIPPNCHFFCHCDNHMQKLYCHINMLQYDRKDILSVLNRCIVLENRKNVISKAIECYRSTDMSSVIFLKSLFFQVVNEAFAIAGVSPGKIKKYSHITKQAINYINNNLTCKLKLDDVAKYLHISKSQMQKIFKSEIGVSMGTYIDQRIFYEIEKMLISTELSIKQIADKFQFCDQFYFSKIFKKQFGVSPSKYREASFSK